MGSFDEAKIGEFEGCLLLYNINTIIDLAYVLYLGDTSLILEDSTTKKLIHYVNVALTV